MTCRVFYPARQPYYRWLANLVTDAEAVAAYRANTLFDAHRDSPEFGYPYMASIPPHAGDAPTERRTGEGKFYLCATKDVFTSRIVGYSGPCLLRWGHRFSPPPMRSMRRR